MTVIRWVTGGWVCAQPMMALASAMTPLGICGSRLCTGGSVKKGERVRERVKVRAREEENKAKESGDRDGQVLE